MVEILRRFCAAIGTIVYGISYPLIWVFWNAAGKYIVLAFKKVSEKSANCDAQFAIAVGADITVLRQMLVNAYYNVCYEEALCARSA